MTDIQNMNSLQLFNKFKAEIKDLGFHVWGADLSKTRGNALECLHRLIELNDIRASWYQVLMTGCTKAISSYAVCSGYAKQWKQLRLKLHNEAPSDAEFTIVKEKIKIKDIPLLLDKMQVVPDELKDFTDKICKRPLGYKSIHLHTYLRVFPDWNFKQLNHEEFEVTVNGMKFSKSFYNKLVINNW